MLDKIIFITLIIIQNKTFANQLSIAVKVPFSDEQSLKYTTGKWTRKRYIFVQLNCKLDFLKRARNLLPEQSQHERARATNNKLTRRHKKTIEINGLCC